MMKIAQGGTQGGMSSNLSKAEQTKFGETDFDLSRSNMGLSNMQSQKGGQTNKFSRIDSKQELNFELTS